MNVSPHLVSMVCAVIYPVISSVSVRRGGQVATVIKVQPIFAMELNKIIKINVVYLSKKIYETNYDSLIFFM